MASNYNRYLSHWLDELSKTLKVIYLFKRRIPYHLRIKSPHYNQMWAEALQEAEQVQKWRQIKQEKEFWKLTKK